VAGENDEVWDAFDGRPHELRMGLRPLDPAAWTRLLSPEEHTAELDRKAGLLAERRSDVFAAIDDPGVPPASRELADLLVQHLVVDHAGRYRRQLDGIVLNDDGRSWPTDAPDPLDLAGRLVSEDWCLVRPGDPPVLAAATLCSPNRWRLAEKLGRPITEVHDPVPGYRRRLGPPVDKIFAGRRGPMWRRNWSIQSSPSRFQPFADGPEHPDVPEEVWVRSEYETLIRLPLTGWWVFGINTTVWPLAALAHRPDVAARLLTAVATLDPEMAAYKDMVTFREPLTTWLESAASGPSP
jgi:hypothetical protein